MAMAKKDRSKNPKFGEKFVEDGSGLILTGYLDPKTGKIIEYDQPLTIDGKPAPKTPPVGIYRD